MSDVKERIVAAIYDVTRPERPDLTDHAKPLLADALDSLDFASLLMALEDEFGVSFADENPEALGTIDQLVSFIESRRAA